MTAALLELPTEFGGRPDQVIRAAQDQAESMLPANLVAVFGQARAEQMLLAATCHVLTVTRAGTGEETRPAPMGWAGSGWGESVAAALGQHHKPTGRTRAFPLSTGEV